MDQAAIEADVPTTATGKFSGAELQMLRYQLEEAEFAQLIRLASSYHRRNGKRRLRAYPPFKQ